MQFTTDKRALNLLVKLLIAVAIVALMVLGKAVLVPLGYSLLLAMVLHPMVGALQKRGLPGWASITVVLLGVCLVLIGSILVLVMQLDRFLEQLPQFFSATTSEGPGGFKEWVEARMGRLDLNGEEGWTVIAGAIPGGFGELLPLVLNTLLGSLFNLFIIPVFTALLLYHRHTYVAILLSMADPEERPKVQEWVQQAVGKQGRFILGMAQVYLIVGALNSIGFLVLGVPYPFLFGMLTAVMTMIPYVGIMVSALLPISLAYTSTGSYWMPLGVIGVLAAVQYLEANLIFPKVVGGKLGLGTLASLLSIFIGGLIWGVAGMILFLPLVSILKMAGMLVPSWRPWTLFLGDQEPDPSSEK